MSPVSIKPLYNLQSSLEINPKQTVPTGFKALPPPGPAIPLTPTQSLDALILTPSPFH